MAEKVELIIEVENVGAIKNIRDTQKAFQEMHDESASKGKKHQDSIADLDKQMKKLFMENKNGFSDVAKMEAYTKKMDELKKKYEELSKAQKDKSSSDQQVKKSTDQVGESLGSLAKEAGIIGIAVGALTKVMNGVKEAFKDTVLGLNLATIAGEQWTQMTYNIATGNFNMGQSLAYAAGIAKQTNNLRKEERKDLVESAKLQTEYNRLYFQASDRTQDDSKRLEKMNTAMDVHNRMIDVEVKNAREQLMIVEQQLILRPKSNKLLDEQAKLYAKVIEIEGRRYSETKRLESQRTSLEEEIWNKKLKAWDDEIEASNDFYEQKKKDFDQFWTEWNKIQEDAINEAIKLNNQLRDDYNKVVLDTAPLVASLKMQRNFAIKELEKLKTDIIKNIGALTPEQEKYFSVLAKDINDKFQESMDEVINPDILGSYLERTLDKGLQKDIIPQKEELTSIWQILGIDPDSDKGQEQINAIQEAADTVKGVIDDVFDKRVENAQRERELLDNQIQETQNALELEVALMQEGYANNVAAKQKELEELKKQRANALIEEEKALKAQQMMERISQGVSLASSVANILKSFTKLGPIGLGLAAVAIGTLYTIFATAKAKAVQATTMAKGGSGDRYGLVSGKLHSQGGEKFLDHVEVERGEAFGVLSREATSKYGKVFHKMVASFNKDQMPEFIPQPVSNSVTVENNGPNTRLDRLIGEQRRLNEQMNGMTRVSTSGTKRIIQRGKNLRIIG